MEDGAKVVSEGSSRFLGYVEDYDLTTAVKYAVRALELMSMIGEPAACHLFLPVGVFFSLR